jgi:ribosomal protein S20
MTSKDEATKKYREVMQILDRSASHGLIHKKNSSRHKARLATFVNKLA